jgi:hypothetical protein
MFGSDIRKKTQILFLSPGNERYLTYYYVSELT